MSFILILILFVALLDLHCITASRSNLSTNERSIMCAASNQIASPAWSLKNLIFPPFYADNVVISWYFVDSDNFLRHLHWTTIEATTTFRTGPTKVNTDCYLCYIRFCSTMLHTVEKSVWTISKDRLKALQFEPLLAYSFESLLVCWIVTSFADCILLSLQLWTLRLLFLELQIILQLSVDCKLF